mgnify:FL=1
MEIWLSMISHLFVEIHENDELNLLLSKNWNTIGMEITDLI